MGQLRRTGLSRIARVAVTSMLGLALLGCSDEPTDETPSGAVRLFLAAMEQSEGDPSALRTAYGLLSATTRRALMERAHLAESLGAARVEPWEMLVRGRYRQSFVPGRGSRGMRESIDGEHATVSVTSEGRDRRAEVPLVLEDGRWRIVLEIPPVRAATEE